MKTLANVGSVCLWRVALVVALVVIAMAATAQTRYVVTDLGTLQGGFLSCAMGLNNHGWTEVMDTRLDNFNNLQLRATVTIAGVKIDLGTLGGPDSWINWGGINQSGRAVGYAETSRPDPTGEDFCGFGTGLTCRPFLWSGDMSALPTLGGNNGQASGINSRGQIVGLAETADINPGCPAYHVAAPALWQGRTVQQLPVVAGDIDGVAFGINDLGHAVGYSGTCTAAVHAVLWQNGVVVELPNLGSPAQNAAVDINNRGQIVGDSSPDDTTFHAALWQNGAVTDLGLVPGDFASMATGINDKGQVVGSTLDANFNWSHAFIWQNGVMTPLNTLFPADSVLYPTMANRINSRGQISGMATVVSGPHAGEIHAFLATPVYGTGAGILRNAVPNPAMPASIRKMLLRKSGLVRLR